MTADHGTIIDPPAASADPDLRPRGRMADLLQRAFFALVVRPFLILFIGVRVRGREHLPERGPFLLIANHTSHLDTVSILAMFPLARLKELRPVAAADYFTRNRLVAAVSRTFFHILPIVRQREQITGDNDPKRKMLAALRSGTSLVVFPEGTRNSTEEEVGRFKGGVAHLVENHPGLPVVPVYLVNMGRSLPKGEWIPLPFFCEVHIGPARVLSGTREEIVAALRDAVTELKP